MKQKGTKRKKTERQRKDKEEEKMQKEKKRKKRKSKLWNIIRYFVLTFEGVKMAKRQKLGINTKRQPRHN